MSSENSVQLTEDQEKFLNSLEEEFRDRYTENDEDFKAVLNERLPAPPIVENWGDFRHRDERHGNYRARHTNYHSRRDRDFDRDNYQNYGHYDSYDRDYGGSYSQSSRQNYRYRSRNYYADSYRPY